MRYVPQILYNPKSTKVEFMCGSRIYIFEPREHRPLDGFVANHALKTVNTGLIVYNQEVSKEDLLLKEKEDIDKMKAKDYKSMPWKRLLKLSAELGVSKKVGAKREEIEREIEKKLFSKKLLRNND